MARAKTTSDVFNAIAEPRRREIIELLADGESRAVGELVDRLSVSQSAVSKHLGVLRSVGIVSVTTSGPLRLYRLQPKQLKPVHDWTKQFEQFWLHQIDRIKERAERKAQTRSTNPPRKE
ncbi:MAG: metalloregulator ArsR/SmtB family transcription factor [Bryobacteraceae bacterium]